MSDCSSCTIISRAVIISALGLGVGLYDSARPGREITFGRTPPPPINGATPAPNVDPPPLVPPKPIASDKKPGDPGWVQTPKDVLPKTQITLDEAKKLFDSGASFVDARRKEDYEKGHIKGAIRLNLASFSAGDPPLLAMIPRDASVCVYCSGGNCDESEHVAEFLANSGYSKVYVIHDGYPGWADGMHWPIETGEGIQ